MKSKAELSIIIPNLHSPIIDQTIESLLQQKINYSFEIIVVGQDKFRLVDKYENSRIKHIKTASPTPPGIARNIGVANSVGNYIFFIDADCIASQDWLQEHMKVHEHYNDPVVVGGSVSFPSINYLTLVDNISTFHEYMEHIPAGNKEQLPSLNMSLSRQVWEKFGGLNPDFLFPAGEDAEFTTKIYISKLPLLFEPKANVQHLPERNQITDLVIHSFQFGYYSIKGNTKYRTELKVPFILKSDILSILFSPILAGYVIIKILFKEKLPIRFWKTLPVVFLLKITWCLGIAKKINNQKKWGNKL